MEPKVFPARLFPMMALRTALLFLAFLPAFARAGDFQLSGSVDKSDVELGDTLQYTLTLTVNGSLTFQPQVETPAFPPAFVAQGPSRSENFSWVNGNATQVYSLTWSLEASRPGRYTLGPYRATANDALHGGFVRQTLPIVVTVRHPKDLGYPLPSAAPSPQPTPDDEAILGIKPDQAAPWDAMAEALGLLLFLLGVVAWIAQHNPPKVVEEVLPADPLQAAFARLDTAQKDFLASTDGRRYAVQVGEALRLYLRQRLDLRPGLTLAEAVHALRLRAPQVRPSSVQDLRRRLELLLYGGSEFRPEEQSGLDAEARGLIRGLEEARRLNPSQQALSKTLDRMAALWREGQAKSAWMGMRSAVVEHARKGLKLGPGPLPRAALARMVKPLDAPELIRSLEALFSEAPPRAADPTILAARLLSLAQALDATNQSLFDDPAPSAGEDPKNDSSTEGEA